MASDARELAPQLAQLDMQDHHQQMQQMQQQQEQQQQRQRHGDGDTDGDGVEIRVGNSVTGVVYTVRVVSTDLVVDELREALVTKSLIPARDQILLGGPPFARLDPRRAIESYALPSPDKRVFLYDRRLLSQEHPPVPEAVLEPTPIELPSEPSSSSESARLLSESTNPMVRALGEFEAHFQLQVTQSQVLEQASQVNVAASERCVAELEVQADAIGAATANLEIFQHAMSKHFTPFWTEYADVSDHHESLLRNLESYLTALKDVTLHPTLAASERKTLQDCVPVAREREWAAQCEQSHLHLRNQVSQLKQMHDDICADVDALVVAHREELSSSYADTIADLDHMRQHVTAQREITKKLIENGEIVARKIADTSAEINATSGGSMGAASSSSGPFPMGSMQASTSALELCRGINELFNKQHDLLPTSQQHADDIKTSMRKMAAVKTTFFTSVHGSLRKISFAQSKIRDFENSLAMLKEAMNAQKKHFNELEHLAKLPESYEMCLKEIARRVRYGRQFSDRIQSMAEELAQLRDDEVHHREVFLRHYGQHLPRDFVPGLAEKPSHCEFRMRPFDQNLPQIEDIDLEGDDSPRDALTSGSDNESKTDETHHTLDHAAESNHWRQRCDELEAKVAHLTLELQSSKKGSYFGSLVRSDLSEVSARDGDDSSSEFPLMLALAATAAGSDGGMVSSSEAGRSNLLEDELQSSKRRMDEVGSQGHGKDAAIAKLESENRQFVLNAAAFEEEIQERSRREEVLQNHQLKLQQTVQALQLSVNTQRASLTKVLNLLGLLPPHDRNREGEELDEFLSSHVDRVEERIRELVASADTEKVLRQELERRHDEINLLESQHLEMNDSFKISFRSFNVDDLALFLPTSAPGSDAQRVYLAFHHECPYRFLADESISSFMKDDGRKYPDFVVGRIVYIDEQVATETHNPYGLNLNTVFYVLMVASLHDAR